MIADSGLVVVCLGSYKKMVVVIVVVGVGFEA